MKKYIRLGEIPDCERSLNYLKINYDQQEDIRWSDKQPFDAAEWCKKNCNSWKNVDIEAIFEPGVSVFEMDDNGNPVLNNEALSSSWNVRKEQEKPCYVVTGDVVGIGQDGEPLLKNVKIIDNVA